MSAKQRKQMIEPHLREPSISRQCQLLSLSRFYYAPVPISAEDLELMRLIDEQYLKTPTFGSGSMVRHFRRQGRKVNWKWPSIPNRIPAVLIRSIGSTPIC